MKTENIYIPESMYMGWMSVSFVLITLSLLFYHMTRVKSLKMSTQIAGMYAVILIIISCIISLISIIPYYTRYNEEKRSEEYIYHILYIICGVMVIIIELLIASTIIKIEYM